MRKDKRRKLGIVELEILLDSRYTISYNGRTRFDA